MEWLFATIEAFQDPEQDTRYNQRFDNIYNI
jgi:hypothetical protein